MAARAATRSWWGLAAALVAVVVLWWQQGGGALTADEPPRPAQSAQSSAQSSAPAGVDPDSGLPWLPAAALPAEARDTLERIDSGGPYRYEQDGSVFSNREGILPDRPEGYYHEYTVETPGSDDRGARRIVAGPADEFYWTDDHYASFSRIAR